MSEAISTPLSLLSQLPLTSTIRELFFAAVVAALVYQALLVWFKVKQDLHSVFGIVNILMLVVRVFGFLRIKMIAS